MSAPTTHDPRFVNTRDGVCWERRAVTDSGLGLYAVEGSCKCPPFKMATFVELAAHGIVEWADVLPMPVGPVPQLSELERLRLRVDEVERAYTFDTAALKRRIAELEAERHTTNEALDDAVQALSEKAKREAAVAEFVAARAEYITALRNCHGDNTSDYDRWQGHAAARRQLAELLGLPVAWPVEDASVTVSRALTPVAALREDVSPQVEKLRTLLAGQRSAVEDPHDSPLYHDYKGPGRDFPELGGAS